MISSKTALRLAVGSIVLVLASCGGARQDFGKKLTPVPVHGKVLVDGKPVAGVEVRAIPAKRAAESEKIDAGSLLGDTDSNGEYWMFSYKPKDGLPPGDYSLTFRLTGPKGNIDDLKNKYDTAPKSPKKITVEAGKPLEVETIDLTTQ